MTKTSIFDQLNLTTDTSLSRGERHDLDNQNKARVAFGFIKTNAPFSCDLDFIGNELTPELKEATVFMAMWIRHNAFFSVKKNLFFVDGDGALFADKELTRIFEIELRVSESIEEANDDDFLSLASRIKDGLIEQIQSDTEYYLKSAQSSLVSVASIL